MKAMPMHSPALKKNAAKSSVHKKKPNTPGAKPLVHKKKPNQNKPKMYQKLENKPKTHQNKPKTTGSQVTVRPYQTEKKPKTSGSKVIGRPYQTENEPKRKVWTTGTKGKTIILDADSASATSDHARQIRYVRIFV